MSKNDKKRMKSEWDAAIRKNEKKLARDEKTLTRYVKSVNPKFVDDNAVKKLIEMAQGSVVETIPFADASNQFKVKIKRKFLEALEGADDVLRISTKPFESPSHNLHPRRQHRSNEPR